MLVTLEAVSATTCKAVDVTAFTMPKERPNNPSSSNDFVRLLNQLVSCLISAVDCDILVFLSSTRLP